MREDYVCQECGHEYEELGDGRCYVCGGSIIPIEEVGQKETEYPKELMEEEGGTEGSEEPWEEPLEEGEEPWQKKEPEEEA